MKVTVIIIIVASIVVIILIFLYIGKTMKLFTGTQNSSLSLITMSLSLLGRELLKPSENVNSLFKEQQ